MDGMELRNEGRSRLSAIGYRLPAAGCWLSAFSFWLSAIGVPSAIPPRHCVALSPPDKQWGAREYIGARHPVSFGVGRSNGVRALVNSKRAFPFEVDKGLSPFERKQTQSSPAGGYIPCPQKKTAAAVFFHISIPGPVPPGSGRCPVYRSGWRRL